jgi:hypothetical protein
MLQLDLEKVKNFNAIEFLRGTGSNVAAQIMPEGVYGLMNGRIVEASSLNKNTEQGRFDI